ncbi:MAG: VWA domain-containing protein, partial [Pseudomonadota bacterium]
MSSEKNSKEVTARSSASEISSFVEKARALAPVREARQARKGRLIFALDATMSRQPTWDLACSLQA